MEIKSCHIDNVRKQYAIVWHQLKFCCGNSFRFWFGVLDWNPKMEFCLQVRTTYTNCSVFSNASNNRPSNTAGTSLAEWAHPSSSQRMADHQFNRSICDPVSIRSGSWSIRPASQSHLNVSLIILVERMNWWSKHRTNPHHLAARQSNKSSTHLRCKLVAEIERWCNRRMHGAWKFFF